MFPSLTHFDIYFVFKVPKEMAGKYYFLCEVFNKQTYIFMPSNQIPPIGITLRKKTLMFTPHCPPIWGIRLLWLTNYMKFLLAWIQKKCKIILPMENSSSMEKKLKTFEWYFCKFKISFWLILGYIRYRAGGYRN